MDSTTHYHKYKASDMEEIRRLRSQILMGYKIHDKCPRVERISKAILQDIQWDKIAKITDETANFWVKKLNTSINEFRKRIAEELHDILSEEGTTLLNKAEEMASSDEIYDAALTMADKYHSRSKKKTKKPRKHKPFKSKPTNNTHVPITSPPTPRSEPQAVSNSPSIFTTQIPHSFNFNISTEQHTPSTLIASKCPKSPNKLHNSPSSQPRATVRRDSSSSPPTSVNATCKTHQAQPSQLSNTTNGAHCQTESTNGSYRSTGPRHNIKVKQQSLTHSFKVKKTTKRNIFK
jgi:hypothetical protein